MKSRYAQARADFEFLESLAVLEDQVELDAEREPLMQNPTKAKAAAMYESGIASWFREHAGRFVGPRVAEIAARYGEET